MSININSKNDYSNLLSSLQAKDNTGFSITDYKSIKNGSYGKLMKAYYKKDDVKETSTSKKQVSETESKALSSVKSTTGDLKKSASKLEDIELYEAGKEDALAKAVKDFADNYNATLTEAGKSESKNVRRIATSMLNNTVANYKLLKEAGITIGEDGKLSVDEAKVKKSASALKNIFTGNGFGYSTVSKASSLYYAANTAQNKGSAYSAKAGYENADSTGNLFDTKN